MKYELWGCLILHTSSFDMDTQWPRWEVFKKDSARKPHQAVGSVHAVDGEHALLNARNVFVRRPSAISLWVVPASAIFSLTQEERGSRPEWPNTRAVSIAPYELFAKKSHRRSMTFMDHIGQIGGVSPQDALRRGFDAFDLADTLAWWVFLTEAVVATDPDVVESWFAPAKEKTYKLQSQYGFVSPTRGRN